MLGNLDKPYENYARCAMIPLICEYCGKEFQRVKKTREQCNTIITKDSCGSKECSNKKREDTGLFKYGNKNPLLSEELKNKSKQTCLEKYGTEQYYSSEAAKIARKKACLERYGVESPLQNEEIRNKHKKTCMERYGVDNYSKTPECREKVKEAVIQKYGVDNYCQTKEFRDKYRNTSIDKYGVEYYSQTEEYRNKNKQTCLERYGVDSYSKTKEYKKQWKQTCLERYGVEYYSQTEECKEKCRKTCMERYGVPSAFNTNYKFGKTENSIRDWLNSFGFNFKVNNSLLGGKQIDMHDEQQNFAVEYCGLFWHSDAAPRPRKADYHYNKFKICLDNGIKLITLFEDEWKEKRQQCENALLSLLGKPNLSITECEVGEINKNQFNKFCSEYCLLGESDGKVFYGIKSDNQLVGVMSLIDYHKKLKINRMCVESSLSINYGVNKLFSRCLQYAKENNYKEIVVHSDNRWSVRDIYSRIGFTLSKNLDPVCYHLNAKKFNKRMPRNTKNKEGLATIWDCGSEVWTYLLPK